MKMTMKRAEVMVKMMKVMIMKMTIIIMMIWNQKNLITLMKIQKMVMTKKTKILSINKFHKQIYILLWGLEDLKLFLLSLKDLLLSMLKQVKMVK